MRLNLTKSGYECFDIGRLYTVLKIMCYAVHRRKLVLKQKLHSEVSEKLNNVTH